MKKTLFLLLVMIMSISSNAQKIKNIKAEGFWDVVGDVSPAEAKEKALYEAKKNALEKAGIPTNVQSMSFTAISQDDQFYSEDNFTQVNSIYIGGLVSLKKTPEYKESYENGVLRITAYIVADVIVEEKNDPEFIIEVDGFEPFYKNGNEINFSIKSYKDCYIRIFWFNNTVEGEGDMLYPLEEYNNDIQLKAKTLYNFPLSKIIEKDMQEISYIAETKHVKENNFIFIVATKKQIPFIGKVNYNNFFKWYHQIAGDEKAAIKFAGFVVTK